MKPDPRLTMLYSDTHYGCQEYGYIPRPDPSKVDPDDEDGHYEKWVWSTKGVKVRVSRYGVVQELP